jgi:hypothetical protein
MRSVRWVITTLITLSLLVPGTPAGAATTAGLSGQQVTAQRDGRVAVSVDRDDVSATIVLGLVDGRFSAVDMTARVGGTTLRDTYLVDGFTLVGDRDFRADLRSSRGGVPLQVDTTRVEQQAVPALVVLAALARFGIGHVIRWYGKTQVKKAAKSYLLNNISASRWTRIMAPKHKWDSVGAHSKEQVAELMSRAMAEGRHSAHGSSARMTTWNYQGRTIEVTYAKNGGQISNGWVK